MNLERTPVLQCDPRPRGGGRRGRPDSGEAGGGDGRGKAQKGSRATRVRSTCSLAVKTVPAGGRGGGLRWEYDSGDKTGGASQLVSMLALG
jgi:hypothetical protein